MVRKRGSKGTIVALRSGGEKERQQGLYCTNIRVFTQRSQPNKVPVPANSP